MQADLLCALQLPAPILGRFVLEPTASKNYSVSLSKLEGRYVSEQFRVLVGFALNDEEAAQLKSFFIQSIKDGKTDILYIDAGLTPMGKDLLNQYVENMAYSRYYAQNDKHRAGEFQSQAIKSLAEWKNRIETGAFMLYSEEHPSGVRLANLSALQNELALMNHKVYPYGLEQFNVNANMFVKGPLAQGAESGITQKTVGTFKSSNEKLSLENALSGAWGVEKYWEESSKKNLPIVHIKTKVEEIVKKGFESASGRISMSTIYSELEKSPYGFMPNNISAFVLGFVLKEYATEDYFWSNGSNSETMNVEKMKTMIANAINQRVSPKRNFHEEFIVAMSAEQKAFLKCSSRAFGIPQEQCGSIEMARDHIRLSMKKLSFPIWCLKYVISELEHISDETVLCEVIDDYCNIANTANGSKGSESELAAVIGQIVINVPSVITDLEIILKDENCINGMLSYIELFEGGILKQLAAQIGDNGAYLEEVRKRFNADAANWVWNSQTADERIGDVILDYRIILETNKSLPKCLSINDVVLGWNSKTNNIKMSYESIKKTVGDLAPFLELLYGMKTNGLPDQKKKIFYDLLRTQRESFDKFYADQISVFKVVAASFLGDLDDGDISTVYNNFASGQFTKSSTDYFQYVGSEIDDYQKNQLKRRIRDIWFEKTGSKDPFDWSARYDTPILCMFSDEERPEARDIFRIMQNGSPTEAEGNQALKYLENGYFYGRLSNPDERDQCFMERVVGDFRVLLHDPRSIREYITSHTTEKAYEWMDNSSIQKIIKQYADMKYKTGGYESAWAVIDEMDPGELREYLKDLISDNIKVGIEILKDK